MNDYETLVLAELAVWELKMQRSPSLIGTLSKKIQDRVNQAIPDKIHKAITSAIKQMTRAVIFGAQITTPAVPLNMSLEERENSIRKRIEFYRKTAAVEGAITGAGGFILGLADFPLWLTLKIKLLYEIAGLYGYDIKNYKERIYILHIFKLTFSSEETRNKTYAVMANWKNEEEKLPSDINSFDWKSFQQEYRDYIDMAKLLQLVPVIGAAVGAYVNHRLTNKLGVTAMNAYRLRWKGITHP